MIENQTIITEQGPIYRCTSNIEMSKTMLLPLVLNFAFWRLKILNKNLWLPDIKKWLARKRKGAILHEDTLMVHLFQWFRA